MSSGKLYSNSSAVITESDTSKLVRAYSAVCTWDYDHTGGQENYAIYQLSYSTIYIVNGEGTTRLFRWIAIGPA